MQITVAQVDISTMLEEAVHYVKFLQLQIKVILHAMQNIGIFGYLDILDALQDPKHPRYDDYMQIIEDEIGEIEFDPTYFNSHDIKF